MLDIRKCSFSSPACVLFRSRVCSFHLLLSFHRAQVVASHFCMHPPSRVEATLFCISLFGSAFNLAFCAVGGWGEGVVVVVGQGQFLLCVYIWRLQSSPHWDYNTKPVTKGRRWRRRKQQMKIGKKQISGRAELHMSPNKQPCLSAVHIGEAARPCRQAFSCFSFLERSGG